MAAYNPDKNTSSSVSQIPFDATLSLDPLIDYWKAAAKEDDETLRALYPQVEAYLEAHPTLRGPISRPVELKEHVRFLKLLTQPLFPSAYDDSVPAALILPFEYQVVYATAAFKRLFTQDASVLSGRVNLDLRTFTLGKIVSAYVHILRTAYEMEVPFEYPLTFETQHPESGLDLHHKVESDLRFVDVRSRGRPPHLDPERARHLLTNILDLSAWTDAIPPSYFEFYGFSIIRAYDVTRERMVAMLHRDLVEERALVDGKLLPDIEGHVRTLLQMPEVELGLAVLDGSDFYVLNEPEQPLVSTFFSRSRRYDTSDIRGSIFERCQNKESVQTIDDLREVQQRAVIEEDMIQWGVRNVMTTPLFLADELVGFLYLWSRDPASIYSVDLVTLVELLPIFSSAVRRVRDDMRSRVQKMIMGQYTAIHPSVEWRFRQAALTSIRKQERGGSLEVEPIVFENLYPLFAATDIRASSEHRNEAIRRDLLDHLKIADEIVSAARDRRPVAILDHLHARLRRYMHSLRDGLASNDEAAVRDFLQRDLEPMLVSLRTLGDDLEEAVTEYERSTDTNRGALYRRSRAFEESVGQINDAVSDYLDAEQEKLQPTFPHYFEKHQTDGVDFTMYVGKSLLEQDDYDPAFVHVLRLWQLMVLCGVALRTRLLRPHLDVPLETTHLVLVQNTPINIRYRFDETRFDVDGPHHIRFEIMKQRVEKATLRGSSERLTQPNRIAIVYSQDREALEYTEYLDYLQRRGFISSDVESLRVDDLQGVKGLRAFRVGIAAESEQELAGIEPRALREAVGGLDLPE